VKRCSNSNDILSSKNMSPSMKTSVLFLCAFVANLSSTSASNVVDLHSAGRFYSIHSSDRQKEQDVTIQQRKNRSLDAEEINARNRILKGQEVPGELLEGLPVVSATNIETGTISVQAPRAGPPPPKEEEAGEAGPPKEESGAEGPPKEEGGSGGPPKEEGGAGGPPKEEGGAGGPPKEEGGAGGPPKEEGGPEPEESQEEPVDGDAEGVLSDPPSLAPSMGAGADSTGSDMPSLSPSSVTADAPPKESMDAPPGSMDAPAGGMDAPAGGMDAGGMDAGGMDAGGMMGGGDVRAAQKQTRSGAKTNIDVGSGSDAIDAPSLPTKQRPGNHNGPMTMNKNNHGAMMKYIRQVR
jgi:hypothetical protein